MPTVAPLDLDGHVLAVEFLGDVPFFANASGTFHRLEGSDKVIEAHQGMAAWFGKEAKLEFLPYEAWAERQHPEEAKATWEHIARSPNCSMEKARRLLGFTPRHSSLQAVQEAVRWLIDNGRVDAKAP